MGDFYLAKQRRFDFYSCQDVCEFVFVLSGNFQNRLYGLREDVHVTLLFAAIWLTPRLEGHHDCFPDSDICFVCVRIQRSLLADIAGAYLRQVPEGFRLVLENKRDRIYYRFIQDDNSHAGRGPADFSMSIPGNHEKNIS